ncbi:MAG: enoyl-CoA hydratase/isomerase family protein [Burkholderiaceae bacterium]|jgi:methylglutaconyl-CoA hydratase|nr:enoyl-CoA hydratase/isomerase family protein [Burkholderiaceae bacterium]
MSYETLEIDNTGGVARIWLNRPDVRNAMNVTLIAELAAAIDEANADDSVRVIMLGGRGKGFCAGADLKWMGGARDMKIEDNRADTGNLAAVMRRLYDGPKPSVARIHGACFAGGMGLATACDIAIAAPDARFCLSEVKIGLIPAMISPYVIKAIGEHNARRYMLSAEVFDAAEAFRIGFVSELAPADGLDARVDAMIANLLAGSPQAIDATKQLIRAVSGRRIDDALTHDTAERIARARTTDDAAEGIASFFEKRKPRWAENL